MYIVERRIGLAEFKEERFELFSTPLFGPSHGEADEPFYVFDLIGVLMAKIQGVRCTCQATDWEWRAILRDQPRRRSRYSGIQQMLSLRGLELAKRRDFGRQRRRGVSFFGGQAHCLYLCFGKKRGSHFLYADHAAMRCPAPFLDRQVRQLVFGSNSAASRPIVPGMSRHRWYNPLHCPAVSADC